MNFVGMKSRFVEMPATIPYKCKAMFAFQKSPNSDREVCFFSMHVQVRLLVEDIQSESRGVVYYFLNPKHGIQKVMKCRNWPT